MSIYQNFGNQAYKPLPRFRAHYLSPELYSIREWNEERREYVPIGKASGVNSSEAIVNYRNVKKKEEK